MNHKCIALILAALTLTACHKSPTAATPAANTTPASPTPASPDSAGGTPPGTNPDKSFFDQTARAGIAEVDAGTMAQEKAKSAEVKKFGAMMVTDHTQANDKLKAIAASHGIGLPGDMDEPHRRTKQNLSGLSGKDFDSEYIAGQIKDHRAVAELLRTESTSGQDPDAKAFAAETLPVVEGHLKQAEELGKKLKVKMDPLQ